MSTEHDEYRQSKIDGVRAMLDFLEANPTVTMPYLGTFHSFPPSSENKTAEKEEAARQAKLMKPVTKNFSSSYFSLRKTFVGDVNLDVTWNREDVCERVVVGTRDVEAYDVEAVEAHTVEATTEEIVEWVCPDSLMADAV